MAGGRRHSALRRVCALNPTAPHALHPKPSPRGAGTLLLPAVCSVVARPAIIATTKAATPPAASTLSPRVAAGATVQPPSPSRRPPPVDPAVITGLLSPQAGHERCEKATDREGGRSVLVRLPSACGKGKERRWRRVGGASACHRRVASGRPREPSRAGGEEVGGPRRSRRAPPVAHSGAAVGGSAQVWGGAHGARRARRSLRHGRVDGGAAVGQRPSASTPSLPCCPLGGTQVTGAVAVAAAAAPPPPTPRHQNEHGARLSSTKMLCLCPFNC